MCCHTVVEALRLDPKATSVYIVNTQYMHSWDRAGGHSRVCPYFFMYQRWLTTESLQKCGQNGPQLSTTATPSRTRSGVTAPLEAGFAAPLGGEGGHYDL